MFICTTCMENLRQQLHDLPWWLDRLMEAAVGQVRLSDGGRRVRRRGVLHGDDSLASHIEPYRPCKCKQDQCTCSTKKARYHREQDALAHALAMGRSNARASDELQKIHNTLTSWVKDICETRGVELPTLHSAHSMARWLERNASAIAGQEDADRCCDDIADAIRNAERLVNRPIPPRFIGPCVTNPAPDSVLEARLAKGDTETRCNFALTANQKATEVTCPTCKQTHNVDELVGQLLSESGDTLVTVRDLVDWILPRMEKPVPERTLYRWMKTGVLETRGHNERGDAMVRLEDVLDIRDSKPRHAAS